MQDALDFLYAGMPLPDSVDYPREFWEANARMAVKARHEMPWGEKVPGREWRHFVLPLGVIGVRHWNSGWLLRQKVLFWFLTNFRIWLNRMKPCRAYCSA